MRARKILKSLGSLTAEDVREKKTVLRARKLIERGADTIAFASCITKGTPIGYPCPFKDKMIELVRKEAGESVNILDYTH